MPLVYEHAHKAHHYLHDSTAFDAHIYGSGAPEEYHTLMVEVVTSLLGGTPPSLAFHTLYTSWTNKVGRIHCHKNKVIIMIGLDCYGIVDVKKGFSSRFS